MRIHNIAAQLHGFLGCTSRGDLGQSDLIEKFRQPSMHIAHGGFDATAVFETATLLLTCIVRATQCESHRPLYRPDDLTKRNLLSRPRQPVTAGRPLSRNHHA